MSYFGDSSPLNTPPPGAVSYPITTQATAPSSPTKGMAWLNTGTNTLSIYNGASWVAVQGGSGLPAATKADELLISTGAGNTWTPNDTLYLGNF